VTEPSAKQVLDAVLTVQDQIAGVQGEQLQAQDVQAAVAKGIKDAVSDPALWAAAAVAMQSHAKQEAGGWLLGMLRGLLSKALFFALLGLAVYSVGGWAALAALFKTTSAPQ